MNHSFKNVTYDDLVRIVNGYGYYLAKDTSKNGSHRHFEDDEGNVIIIPQHNHEMNWGTVRETLKKISTAKNVELKILEKYLKDPKSMKKDAKNKEEMMHGDDENYQEEKSNQEYFLDKDTDSKN